MRSGLKALFSLKITYLVKDGKQIRYCIICVPLIEYIQKQRCENIMKGSKKMRLLIGENIKKLRKEKGVTQEQLAEILGVSCQSVSRWELGSCYPDLELLPIISNYFEVSVDVLLSNDDKSIEADRRLFIQTREQLPFASEEHVEYIKSYCKKYPKDNYYAWYLSYALSCYITRGGDRSEEYLFLLAETVKSLIDTKYRESAMFYMIRACKDEDVEKWLELCPRNVEFNARGCLVDRYLTRGEDEKMFVQQGLEALEKYAAQLDRRFPDAYGAERKAEYQRSILRTIEAFGDGEVPDGWKLFYAYKQLVLAACLFGLGRHDEGWAEFDSAVEKYKYIYSLDEEYISLGGEMFSNLKVNNDWSYALDTNGVKHELFCADWHSFYYADFLHNFLTNPAWAWFDSVRDTEKYVAFVNWSKDMAEKQTETNEDN